LPEHGGLLLRVVRLAAASRQELQALHRPVLHTEGPRRRRPVAESARPGAGPVRGRESQVQALELVWSIGVGSCGVYRIQHTLSTTSNKLVVRVAILPASEDSFSVPRFTSQRRWTKRLPAGSRTIRSYGPLELSRLRIVFSLEEVYLGLTAMDKQRGSLPLLFRLSCRLRLL